MPQTSQENEVVCIPGLRGRDPKEIERSIGIDIKRIDKADDLLEAGATEVTLAVNGPGYDLAPVKEWISWRDSKG